MAAVTMRTVVASLLVAATPALAKKTPPPAPPPPAPVTAPALTIKTGVERWRAGDYAAAVAIWQPFADAGEPDALFNLGQAYKLGRGVEANAATARDYYRKAAVKGHLPAQANLGIALFQAGEKPEAVKWLKTAADRGEARAQYVLGIAAFNGDGLPRSQSLGYAYLLRAQASGLPQATTALASIQPGLSPADRNAGEAAAASLAAGTGVPPALAAATGPRLIPATPPARTTLPIVTPPMGAGGGAGGGVGFAGSGGSAAGSGVAPVIGQPAPTRLTTAPAGALAPSPSATTKTAAALLPPAPKPAPATPLRQPTPAQADAAALADTLRPSSARVAVAVPPGPLSGQSQSLREPSPARADAAAGARSTIATVDVPPSRLAAPAPMEPAADPDPRGRRAAATGTARGEPAYPGATTTPPVVADRASPAPATDRASPPPGRPLKPFEVADAPAKKPDGWRVQLGAFSSRKLADAAWAGVKDAAAPAKPVFATDGPVTKLQMGPYATRDAAKAACTRLTAAGRACFVTQG